MKTLKKIETCANPRNEGGQPACCEYHNSKSYATTYAITTKS